MHSEISECTVWIGAIAVVLAAVIAAGVAIWRTSVSLKAESERLEKQLQGEAQRLQAQLEHDRARQERAELRAIVDDAFTAAQDGQYRGVEVESLAARRARGEDDDDDQIHYDDAQLNLMTAIRALNGFQSRLTVRLEDGAPLPAVVSECRAGLSMVRLYAGNTWPSSEQNDRKELQEILRTSEENIAAFEREARLLVHSELL